MIVENLKNNNNFKKISKLFLPVLACILLPLALYLNSLHAPFIFDDIWKIVNNRDIRELSALSGRLIFRPPASTVGINDPSRPLTFLTFALNYHFGGLNPSGYHAFNILLHILVTLLIFFLTRIIFDSAGCGQSTVFPLFTALLFASHPVNTEVATYITHRSESLATMFYLCSLLLFTKSFDGRIIFYFLSLISFVLSLMSKQTAVTLPPVLLIFDYFFMGRIRSKKTAHKYLVHIPYWIILLGFIGFHCFYIGHSADPSSLTNKKWTHYTYFITQPYVLLKYLQLLVFPIGQCIDHVVSPATSIFEGRTLISFGLLIMILALWITFGLRHVVCSKLLIFSMIWFFITLGPTSSFIPINDAMAERRLYLPGWGFCLLTMTLYYLIFKIKPAAQNTSPGNASRIPILVMALHVILLSVFTVRRNLLYRDPVKMWQNVLSVYPGSRRAIYNLACSYLSKNDCQNAKRFFKEEIEINPDFYPAYGKLGFICALEGDLDGAIPLYQKALEINPGAILLIYDLGNIYYRKKDYAHASEEFEKLRALAPDVPEFAKKINILKSLQTKK